MTAANLDVRPAVAPGLVAPDAANLTLLFAPDPIPISAHRLVCHWRRNSDGRLGCTWEPDLSPQRIPEPKKPVERFVSRDGSNIVPA
jgi:hypothetical protein